MQKTVIEDQARLWRELAEFASGVADRLGKTEPSEERPLAESKDWKMLLSDMVHLQRLRADIQWHLIEPNPAADASAPSAGTHVREKTEDGYAITGVVRRVRGGKAEIEHGPLTGVMPIHTSEIPVENLEVVSEPK